MKRFVLSLFVILLSISAKAVGFNFYYDGDWHGWFYQNTSGTGNWNDFKFFTMAEGYGISNYWLRVTVSNPILPDKKEMKKMIKTNQWLEFDGTIEYYICDDYPTAYDIWSKRDHGWVGGAHRGVGLICHIYEDEKWNKRPTKRVKKSVRIRIAPFKKNVRTYNIFWENVGLGIILD